MAFIDKKSLEEKISEIQSFCNGFLGKMEDIDCQIDEIGNSNARFKTYDGAKISGSSMEQVVDTEEYTLRKSFYKEVHIHDNSIDNCCNLIHQEVGEMGERIHKILSFLSDVNNSLEVIAIYMLEAERSLSLEENVSFGDKLQETFLLMEKDSNNGYNYLHTHPVLVNGVLSFESGAFGGVTGELSTNFNLYSGRYLRFYNEYGVNVVAPMSWIGTDSNIPFTEEEMEFFGRYCSDYYSSVMRFQNERFTDFHRKAVASNLDKLVLEFSNYERIDGAITYSCLPHENVGCTINANMCQFVNGRYADETEMTGDGYTRSLDDYSLDSFVHETGHVLDNYCARELYKVHQERGDSNLGKYDTEYYSNSEDYQKFYLALCENDTTISGTDYLSEFYNVGERADNVNHSGGYSIYALSTSFESFAESTAEYYGNCGSDIISHYSPSDLGDVTVSNDIGRLFGIEGEYDVTAYDVVNCIINGNIMK